MRRHPSLPTILTAAALALAFAVLATTPSPAETIPLSYRAIALNPANPSQKKVGRLTYMGGLLLRSSDKRFGGLSGLTISADGRQVLAVSDHGFWFSGRLRTDEGGRITGFEDPSLSPILNEYGAPVAGATRDAEAVEHGPGSSLIVSFERRHRLWRYDVTTDLEKTWAKPMPAPRDLARAPRNGGLEAISVLPSGLMLALSEDVDLAGGEKKGWIIRLEGGGHSTVSYTPGPNFKPTDMAALPDGKVLVLERRFTRVGGVAARIALLDAASIQPRAHLRGEELALIQPPLNVDNMEGLAATVAPDGSTNIYILSDNNYSRAQRTLLMKFRLDPPPSD